MNEETNEEFFTQTLANLEVCLQHVIGFKVLERQCTLEEACEHTKKGCEEIIESIKTLIEKTSI